MVKAKDLVERKKSASSRNISLHQIRKLLQRTLPWIAAAKNGTSNNGSSESQTTISENDELEMIDDDIYGSPFTDGIYFESNWTYRL